MMLPTVWQINPCVRHGIFKEEQSMIRFCRTGLRPVHTALGFSLLAVSFLFGCSSTRPTALQSSAATGIPLQEMLSRLPARDAVEQRWVSALLLDRAPGSVEEICGRLDTLKPGNDAQVRYALSGMTAYATLPGHEADRTKYAGALCSGLGMMHNPLAQALVMQQLQLAGKQESVGTLGRFLTDESLCEPAAQALLAIRTPEVAGRMLEALRQVDGSRRITLIRALAELHNREVVPDLMKWATSDDPPLREASLEALAMIGDPRSVDLMQAPSLKVTYAQRLAENGDRELSERICRGLLANTNPPNIRAAALYQLAAMAGERTTDDLIAAARDSSVELRAAALDIAAGVKGEKVTEQWLSVIQQADPDLRAAVIRMLGRRNDPAALPAVMRALKDPDPAVRIAAVGAGATLGGLNAVDSILGVLGRTERADEIAAVQNVITPLPLQNSVPAVIHALDSATPPAQVMLLQICGNGGTLVPSSAIFPFARKETVPVRLAAIKTLENVAEPEDMSRLVQLLLTARNDAEGNAIRRAIAATAARNPVPESRADAILAALDTAGAANKPALLRALGRVGGTRSLTALSRGMASKDPGVKDASFRALSDWPDIGAFDTLLAVAKSKQPLNYRVLAVRGCLRMVDDAGMPADRSARMLGNVLAASPRPEEKRLVLASLGNTRSSEAVRIASDYLGDDSVGLDAALAIKKVTSDR